MTNNLYILDKLAGLWSEVKNKLRGDSHAGSYEAELLKRRGKLVPVPVPVKNKKEFFKP